ncbi:MAG: hypothetical protein VB032_07345 [Burkholderiaceae bacterium]|nr:hypothetical protein [Burkholderiaceae bacterium]
MESSGNSGTSYRAATGLLFVLAAVVVALAGFLPGKSSASGSAPAEKAATVKPAGAADGASLSQEDWLRIAKSL